MALVSIQAGKLRFRAVIEHDPSNDPDHPAWQTFATRLIGIELLRGREAERANQIYGASDSKLTLRYLKGLNSSMRIVADGKIWNLTAALDVDNQHIQHLCYATAIDDFNDDAVQVFRFDDFSKGGTKLSGTAAI